MQVVTNQGTAKVAVYRASLSGNGAAPFFRDSTGCIFEQHFLPLEGRGSSYRANIFASRAELILRRPSDRIFAFLRNTLPGLGGLRFLLWPLARLPISLAHATSYKIENIMRPSAECADFRFQREVNGEFGSSGVTTAQHIYTLLTTPLQALGNKCVARSILTSEVLLSKMTQRAVIRMCSGQQRRPDIVASCGCLGNVRFNPAWRFEDTVTSAQPERRRLICPLDCRSQLLLCS